MAAKPISLGPFQFSKRGDALTFLRDMLNRYDIGDRVSATDADLLRAAIALHPHSAAKTGCGIAHFSVRSADFGTRCFWLNRTDGSTEKFSYTSCVRG